MESNFPGNPKDLLKNRYEPEKLLDGKCVLVVDDDMRNTFALSKVLKDIVLNVVLSDICTIAIENLCESGKKR